MKTISILLLCSILSSTFSEILVTQTSSNTITALQTTSISNLSSVPNDRNGGLQSLSLKIGEQEITNVSSPSSIVAATRGATWVSFRWERPRYASPMENLSYRLYYKLSSDRTYQILKSPNTYHVLQELEPNTQYVVHVTTISSRGESSPSDRLTVKTDSESSLTLETPKVYPSDVILTGSCITVICTAKGMPTPTISLYVSGRHKKEERTHQMVTNVHDVTRDMDVIMCHADNGHGKPVQQMKKISVSYIQVNSSSDSTIGYLGYATTLECKVGAHPEPQMGFWRDADGRVPVSNGENYDIQIKAVPDEPSKYVIRLHITKTTEDDEGDYYCYAENLVGKSVQRMTLQTVSKSVTMRIQQCCSKQKISSTCTSVCVAYGNISSVLNNPKCKTQLHKLMLCAADESDHSECCTEWFVPQACKSWCQADYFGFNSNCSADIIHPSLNHITDCFHRGYDLLPGPPKNVRVDNVTSDSVIISWDVPEKNPQIVTYYMVYWKAIGSRVSSHSYNKSTSDTTITISKLESSTKFQLKVLAGNNLGKSILTIPVSFTTTATLAAETRTSSSSRSVGMPVGVLVVLLLFFHIKV